MKNLSFIADEYSDQNAAAISDWFDAAFAEFENDPIFDELTECEKENGGFMLNCFFDYCYGYHLAGPADIDINIIDDVCLGIMPRKVSASVEAFETFAPTATRFLQWCERQGFLSKITVLCDYITQVSPRMVTNSEDPGNWGMAKSFVLGNLFDAYEPDEDSPEPVAKILTPGPILSSKDAGLPGRQGLKVGRNTPCPCGSGKKYKKCCGK